jgi:hypothetical protein
MPLTAASYGTLSISDLLAVNNTSIIDFGREDVFGVLRDYFAAVNAMINEQITMFAARTTERAVGLGGPANMTAVYTDEYGVADAQKLGGPSIIGFPLRKHQVALQWTYQWMRKHTPQDMAAQAQAAAVADAQKVQSALRTAIFTPTNTTFTDRLRDNMALPVKALANADSFPIPPSPNGDTFNAATHTHYLGTTNAQPTPADISALILNVTEHRSSGKLYLFVPQAFANYVIANRVATYTEFAIAPFDDQTYATTLTLARRPMNAVNQANRIIGMYQGAEVWVKPWVPTGVIWAFIDGPVKPLAMRIPDDLGGDNGDFRPIFSDQDLPLECEVMEREYGFAIRNRVAAAVLSYAGPDTTFQTPANL